jgi:hypothetical protein
MKKLLLAAGAATILAGCAAGGMFGPAPKDGELAMPNGYKTWPVFLAGIEKPTGHVRDIYINTKGTEAKNGEAFPNGTQFVMDIYKATKGEGGKLVKGELDQVFVMYKGSGWGSTAPEGMKTGDWVYSAFDAAGQPKKVDYGTCRGCHIPLAKDDYVFHYAKYFEKRASADGPSYAQMLESHAGMVAMTTQDVKQASQVLK